jgi:hypothetical protein
VSPAPRGRLSAEAAAKLRDTAKVVGWGLALYGGVAVVSATFGHNPTGATAVQAVVAELGAGRLAIAWSDPHGPIPTTRDIARRAGFGAALGVGAAAAVTACALLTHAAILVPNAPALSMLGIGLLLSALGAMRDELLLRGIVLRAFEHSAPPWGSPGPPRVSARRVTRGSTSSMRSWPHC